MIRVSVFYPAGEGNTFDMEYYLSKHITLMKELLGEALKEVRVEEGIAAGHPKAPLPYSAIGHFTYESIEAFQQAMGPNAKTIMGDIPNFTNTQPVVQISKVLVNA